jgi:tetratricopeptide (TPR) repeat protein
MPESRLLVYVLAAVGIALSGLPTAFSAQNVEEILVRELPGLMYRKEGHVNFQPPGKPETPTNAPANLGFGDTLRTLDSAWAVVKLTNQVDIRLAELTRLQIATNKVPGVPLSLNLGQGRAFIAVHGKSNAMAIRGLALLTKTKGTEFVISVDPESQRTEVTMFDGEVELSDGTAVTNAHRGQQAVAIAGQAIVVRALEATNLVQWFLYYPGVLDPNELGLPANEQQELRASLDAYHAGSLPQALAQFPGYPTPAEPTSDPARVYLATLLLSVGSVERAQALLNRVPTNAPLARALRTMIRAVQDPSGRFAGLSPHANRGSAMDNFSSFSASELVALSYQQQASHNLKEALRFARAATEKSPDFGFAWERVAELEFSFGETRRAQRALTRALELSPRNAQAHALRGFLLAAENRIHAAFDEFNQAINLDPALANAWLGRGLCKFRLGWNVFGFLPPSQSASAPNLHETTVEDNDQRVARQAQASALDDLATAALLEPNRSLLHSYLGKAFTDRGDSIHAFKELTHAKRLDTNDPTPWLYSALLNREENRVNTAVAELERSLELNDNRAVYRSHQLLDQDRAVRSSGLARVYQDAGMNEVAVREAARAVTYDYANYSGHLFLSESYNALRDPTRFNLRNETIWFNELLLANLLSPVGGTPLSQHISQQEYSRLFEQNRIGLSTDSSYRSDGQYRELASQFGVVGNTAWALDLDYQHNNGVRPNNELDRIEWFSTLKQQVTPQDTLLAQVKYEDYSSGDNFQYYNPDNPPDGSPPNNGARPNFKFTEYQQPLAIGGWHHQWSPGVHTLLLGGRLATEQNVSDRAASQLMLIEDPTGATDDAFSRPFDVNYHGDFTIYLTELNQLFQWRRCALSLGGRWQSGSFQTRAEFTNPPAGFGTNFTDPVAKGSIDEDFNRWTGYGYLTLEPVDHLWLIGGLAYDDVSYPANFRNPPPSSGQAHNSQLGPKGGLVWNPAALLTLRGAYTKSLGGVSADESYRLEQTQVAGFPQAFRSLIPESLAGSVSAPEFETCSVGLDLKFPSRTYVGLEAQQLNNDVNRTVGTLVMNNGLGPFVSGSTPEQLRYRESSIGGTVNQLLGDFFAVGTGYSFNRAKLHDAYPQIPLPGFKTTQQADLHKAGSYILFNHPSGFFARADATWYHQHNSGYNPPLPGDEFVQENVYLGYRFLRRRAEVMFGVLNLSDQDYHLNPLSTYMELPRERAYMLRANFIF